MNELKPDASGFRYILMWMDSILKDKHLPDRSFVMEWRDFTKESLDHIETLERDKAELERQLRVAQEGWSLAHVRVAELEAQAVDAWLLRTAKKYRDNYLLDEIDEPELCISKEQHNDLLAFSAAIDAELAKKG